MASCFSEYELTKVASKSNISESPGGAAAHTIVRAAAIASGIARNWRDVVASTARQAVAIEATGPNSSDCSRRAARSARQSAPSAMATARWVRTTPGSWVCQLIPQPAMASDMAPVSPLRSASSDNSAVPAWDTRFFPSVVTLIDWAARLSCTFKEPSWFCGMCCVETHILPEQGGFSADANTLESGVERIFEASPKHREMSHSGT